MNRPGNSTSAVLQLAALSVSALASKARTSQPVQSSKIQLKGSTSSTQAKPASKPTFRLSPTDWPWLRSGSRWLRTPPHPACRCW